jgi:ATP-dependent DNA helicase RecG
MAIRVLDLTSEEVSKLLERTEGHFLDMKDVRVAPGKLTKHMSAFANADGGELFIGVTYKGKKWLWEGFENEEAANGHVQAFEEFFPLSPDVQYQFLRHDGQKGFVLHVTILKTREIRKASDGTVYVRRGAESLPIKSPEALQILQRAKGLVSQEDATLNVAPSVVTNSEVVIGFMLEVIPHAEPDAWLRKQQLVVEDKPTVAAAILFAEEPQAYLPKAGVKIYRYKTSAPEGTRDTLAFDPITIEGALYEQIRGAVARTVEITEQIRVMRPDGLHPITYPQETLHEIITNGCLHRDYALNDDVHVRIFDDRIEVESPGRLPAHITPQNILTERFARNPKTVRLINKFPNPPNKDVGEGLNTAFQAMQQLRLREPQIVERENSVLVYIRHEPLASPEQQIVEYIREKGTINNAIAREISGIQSEVKIRSLFRKLIQAGEIEQVPGTFKATTAYRIPQGRR